MLKTYLQGLRTFLMMICLLGGIKSFAQKEAFTQSMQGYLKVGDSTFLVDDKYAMLAPSLWAQITHLKVQDIVSFQLRFDTLGNIPNQPFKADIVVDIYYWGSDQQQTVPGEKKNITLKIEYDTTKGKFIQTYDVYEFANAHKIAVVIRNISSNLFNDSLPPFFQLKQEIIVKRRYPFDPNAPIEINLQEEGDPLETLGLNQNEFMGGTTALEGSPELEGSPSPVRCHGVAGVTTVNVTTGPLSFPFEHDLEYCFIDLASEQGYALIQLLGAPSSLTPQVLKPFFRNNATRVTLSAATTTYPINLVYGDGFMLYRIRGVGYTTDDIRVEGTWSYENPTNSNLKYIQSIGNGAKPFPHEACLNWQYNASFAEDGKRKEIVTYFDGKLQNRQTVTISSIHSGIEDAKVAVVQETILDEYGRSAASILPTPVNSYRFKYFRNINISQATGEPYSYKDIQYTDCEVTATPLDKNPFDINTEGGAAWYYSINSESVFPLAINHKFIPSAESENGSYPLAVTQYTDDQTGRIRRQGGVGEAFQLKNNDTRYYYGKPLQYELDRLFGTEAGNASHYLKNMVVDPNGQISVSYINSTGKTIATALAGSAPFNLDNLPSFPQQVNITNQLMKSGDFKFDGASGVLVGTSTFLAPLTGYYVVAYNRDNIKHVVHHSDNLSQKLCYECYYDIEIAVTDNCGVSLLPNGPLKIPAGSFDGHDKCGTTPANGTQNFTVYISAANLGECHVSYSLKLNKDAEEAVTKDHWESNTSLKRFFDNPASKESFIKDYLEKAISECFTDCISCAELSEMTEQKFADEVSAYLVKLAEKRDESDLQINQTYLDIYLKEIYGRLINQCAPIINLCLETQPAANEPCSERYQVLISDVTPGGQYALYSGDPVTLIDPVINILNTNLAAVRSYTRMPPAHPNHPDNNPGNPNLPIYPDPNNPGVSDRVLNSNGVLTNPENLTPEEFINSFRPHWAFTLVYWHPEYCYYKWCTLNSASQNYDIKLNEQEPPETFSVLTALGDVNNPSAGDPFFMPGGYGAHFYDAMKYELENYSKIKAPNATGSVKDILGFIDYMLYCSHENPSTWETCAPVNDCRNKKREWALYVSFYQQLKYKYEEMARRCWQEDCHNAYIGTDGSTAMPIDGSCTVPSQDQDWINILQKLPIQQLCGLEAGECYPSIDETDDRRPYYIEKTRVYPEYVSPCTILEATCINTGTNTTPNINTQVEAELNANCGSAVDNLIEKLQDRKSCGISEWTTGQVANLRAALFDVCSSGTMAINQTNAFGIIEIVHPYGVSSNGTTTFDAVLTSFNIPVANGCSNDLVSIPYPHDKFDFITENALIDRVTRDICSTRLNVVKAKYTLQYGGSPNTQQLHAYLLQIAPSDYQLTLEELENLLDVCNNNCDVKLLNHEIRLPAVLSKSDAILSCSDVSNAVVQFNAKYTALSADDEQYEMIFRNFMNHHFGFGLPYVDYYDFMAKCSTSSTAILVDQAATPGIKVKQKTCTELKIEEAFSNAIYSLYQYKDSVNNAFKNAYRLTCRYAKPAMQLTMPFQEYHYTLYYYDQAGNLVRTVPPEGVRPLTDPIVSLIAHPWETQSAPATAEMGGLNTSAILGMPLHQGGAYTIETQLKLLSSSGAYKIFQAATSGNSIYHNGVNYDAGLQLSYVNGDFILKETIVSQAAPQVDEHEYIFSSITLTPALWYHLAVVYDAGALHKFKLYVNGTPYVPSPPSGNTHVSSGGSFTAGNGSGAIELHPSNSTATVAQYRETRFYLRPLMENEIRANMYMVNVPYDNALLLARYPLNDGVDYDWKFKNVVSSSYSGNGTVNWAANFTETQHQLITSYAYNSLNQVVKQNTPDGGTSAFWYDILGRLSISQNAEQKSSSTGDVSNRHSYTKYDGLGRIIEVGEKVNHNLSFDDEQAKDTTWLKDTWHTSGTNRQITVTRYNDVTIAEDGNTNIPAPPTSLMQENLRNRVAGTFYLESAGNAHKYATYYNYDISGNVKTLWQQLVPMVNFDGSGIKRMDYQYDLVSGKVNDVWYQQGKKDQYYYQYVYDGENRLTEAWSGRSDNTPQLRKDAAYFYYLHGPLARTELGHKQLQGVDYAYTLQGWLKGVNGTFLDPAKDMGQDGLTGGIHSNMPLDVFAFTLNYYNKDYKGINATSSDNTFLPYSFSQKPQPVGRELFNGNIAAISLALTKLDGGKTTGYSYGYDQLNRLLNMRKHNDISGGADWGASSIDNNKYKEQYSYDANGNIQTLLRNGAATTTNPAAMDNLVYWYYYMASNDTWQVYNSSNMPASTSVKYFTNRLAYVTDAVTPTNYTVDIDNQSSANYTYDKIGNMIADVAEGVTSIGWNVYGKIKSVVKNKNSLTTNITYEYDVSGNRVMKQVGEKTTFYIRDAQGNVMGVYEALSAGGYTWEEQHLYGSSRLGMFTPRDFISNGTISNAPPVSQDLDGKRTYELSNHLGNVHVTICDIKRQVGSVWNAEILTTSDYYPFGMLMPERHGYKVDGGWASGTDDVNGNNVSQTLSVETRNSNGTPGEYKASQWIEFTDGFISNSTDEFIAYIADGTNTAPANPAGSGGQYNSYRYGFNGKENDDEVKGVGNQIDYGDRVYDVRLARFLSVDPLTQEYPELTAYQYASNSPVALIDIDGREGGWELSSPLAKLKLYGDFVNKMPARNTNNPATSVPKPKIQPIILNALKAPHSEEAPVVVQKIRQTVRVMNQTRNKTKTEKTPDYIGNFINTGNNFTEHGEMLSKWSGKSTFASGFSKANTYFSGAEILYNTSKGNYTNAAIGTGELLLSRTPAAPYYYSAKVLESLLKSDYNLGRAYGDADRQLKIAVNNLHVFSNPKSKHYDPEMAKIWLEKANKHQQDKEGLEKIILKKYAEK